MSVVMDTQITITHVFHIALTYKMNKYILVTGLIFISLIKI